MRKGSENGGHIWGFYAWNGEKGCSCEFIIIKVKVKETVQNVNK